MKKIILLMLQMTMVASVYAGWDLGGNYSGTGFSGQWKSICGEDSGNENYCINSTDIAGQEKSTFLVGEAILLDLTNINSVEWSARINPPIPNILPAEYDRNNPIFFHSTSNWKYSIGWSFYGSYLDDSCHALLRRQAYGSSTAWWWQNGNDCYAANEKLLSYPDNGQENTITYHIYENPGTYIITALPLVFSYMPNDYEYVIQPLYKTITVVDGLNYSWMIPVISLILN